MAEQFMGQVPSLAGHLLEDEAVLKAVAAQRAIADLSAETNVVPALTGIVADLGGVPRAIDSRISTHAINSTTATADIRE